MQWFIDPCRESRNSERRSTRSWMRWSIRPGPWTSSPPVLQSSPPEESLFKEGLPADARALSCKLVPTVSPPVDHSATHGCQHWTPSAVNALHARYLAGLPPPTPEEAAELCAPGQSRDPDLSSASSEGPVQWPDYKLSGRVHYDCIPAGLESDSDSEEDCQIQ